MIFLKPRKLSHGKELLRTKNFTLIYLGSLNFHYSFILRKQLFYGSIDLKRKRFKLIPLFVTASLIALFLGFGPIQNPTDSQVINPVQPISEVIENDKEDMEAKNADDDYLKETEAQKLAILNLEEDSEESYEKVTRYTIKEGETLESISQKYSLNIEELAELSGLESSSELKSGDYVYLPGRNGLIYTFQKGDSLARLVNQYNISVDDVIYENKLTNPDIFLEGQKIFLPGAYIPDPPQLWFLPVSSGVITSDFGWRAFPRSQYHDALDLKAAYEPVRAARSGIVIYSGWMGGYGNVVILQHNKNLKTLYGHNSKLFVKRGDKIEGGKVISRSGCTGYCFGAHLHFEIIKDGVPVDPKKYIKGFISRDNE